MGKLQIHGQVLYNDLTPAVDASVQIWELDDAPGGSDDKILVRTSNSQGRFHGRSTEWNDREGRVIVDLPDIMNLEFRVSTYGRNHKGPFVWANGASIPIVLPFGPPKPVQKANRALVQVIHLSNEYQGNERALYQFIEASSEGVVATALGPVYKKIHVIKGSNATLAGLKNTLRTAANAPGITAVDLMLNTHGASNRIPFADGSKTMTEVKTSLNGLSTAIRGKFRSVFSTACFGATHIGMWTSVGFSSACGSKGIYADSAVSFAPLVGAWAMEPTFASTIQTANSADVGNVADNLAIAYYNSIGKAQLASQIDSTRVVGGNGEIRIYSTP